MHARACLAKISYTSISSAADTQHELEVTVECKGTGANFISSSSSRSPTTSAPMTLDQHRASTEEEAEDAILSARFGDLDELRSFVDAFGADALANARDGRGNSALHMAAANGHVGAHSPPPSVLLLRDFL
jgi:hypothetical protein